jgi:ribosomal protein L11 methyltransferase
MYLWRRRATRNWLRDNGQRWRGQAGLKLALIERPNRRRFQIEVASKSRQEVQALAHEFGGRIVKLPQDWLKRFALQQKTKPLKIGQRLVITNVGGSSVSRQWRRQGRSHILIPAGAAFGTGEHATTAMCLRLLERIIDFWGARAPSHAGDGAPAIANFEGSIRRGCRTQRARRSCSPELVVDLGTGTGILALAARVLGVKRVIGIDNDPTAISTATENARRNKIDDVDFKLADLRSWKLPRNIDIITANLFSELLTSVLPKLKRARWLILSGILREQERELTRALKRHKIDIVDVRRRGKWVAILARQLRRS